MRRCNPRVVKLQTGDTNIIPTNIPLEILYEDDAMCATNPLHGIHPVRNHLADTLLNAVVYRMNEGRKRHGIHLVAALTRILQA